MQGAAKARRRARERRQTVGVLMTLALALIVTQGTDALHSSPVPPRSFVGL